MLIVVAALCVWLATVCQNAARQKHAIALIHAAGGEVEYFSDRKNEPFSSEPNPPSGLGWLCKLTGPDYFGTAGFVCFIDKPRMDVVKRHGNALASSRDLEALEALGDLPGLQQVVISGTKVPDWAMARIGTLQLRYLALIECAVSPDGWKSLEGLSQLNELVLGGTSVDDATLSHVRATKSLRSLNLWGTRITDRGLLMIGTFRSLEFITLGKNPSTTVAGANELRRMLPNAQISLDPW